MAKTFKSAMREYAPVVYLLAVADMVVAGWLVGDLPPSATTFGLYVFCVVVLWAVTVIVTAFYAAKEVWLYRLIDEASNGPSHD